MASTKVSDIISATTAVMYNPNQMQDAVMDTLTGINNGVDYDVLDPNNPVIWSAEASVMLAQTSIESHSKTLRRRNAVMAVDMEDLYNHMSDEDWIDPFAQPSAATFRLILGKAEIMAKAAPKNSNGTRKLIIPADTEFTVGGLVFTLQYPIVINVLSYGGMQVVYDTTVTSPVTSLTSRSLTWSNATIPYNGVPIDMVVIEIPALQYKINTYSSTITTGISWKNTYGFDDSYFYARVWQRVNGKWVELKTTHSEEVIDLMSVTVQLKVLENEVEVYIPDVYIRSGMISGDIRVDVYSTKGATTVDLSTYGISEFSTRFLDISKTIETQYTAPLKTFSHFSIISDSVTRGGRNCLTFEELRTRVIDNSFSGRTLPISEKQLVNAVSDLGFTVSKSIDYVTERIYHATGAMPYPSIEDLSTTIGTVNGILETSAAELIANDSVMDNGNRITILPDTLYKYVNGLVEVDSRNLSDYNRLTPNQRVSIANSNTLLFSPFHYVLDFNDDIVEERAYYLAKPSIDNKRFVTNNNTLALDISTSSQLLESTETGYRLVVQTMSGAVYKTLEPEQKHAQISYTPRGYTDEYAWVDGKYLGESDDGEAIFEFLIETTLDIDRNHDLIVSNFTLVGDKPSEMAMRLSCEMNIMYGVSNYNVTGYSAINADQIYNSTITSLKTVTHEILSLNFGMNLPLLWTNARTIVGSINYKRYKEDVYLTYSKDVFKRNASTGVPEVTFTEVKGVKKATPTYLHRKGDYVLDKFGNKQIQYKVGDVVRGLDGEPEIASPRTIRRRLEMYMMDAKFLLSDAQETIDYLEEVTQTLIGYVTQDLPSIDTNLLEKTMLYYYPETTLGNIEVLLGDGTTTSIDAENQFNVYYYLTTSARQNSDFLETLSETTRSAILVNLQGDTVSSSAITEEIRSRMGDEIVDVEFGGMGPDKDQRLFTVTDSRYRPTIGKKLVVNADWSLSIKDDISIGYNSHEVTS